MEKRHAKIKKRKNSLLYTPVGISFLAIALIYIAYSSFGVFAKWKGAHAKLIDAQDAYSATAARYDAISNDLRALSTDRGKEEIVREKFNVVKAGEGVVVLPSSGTMEEEAVAPLPKEKKSFWAFLKGVFRKDESGK
ncbi:MAG: hypothetical protein RL641_750 [Candidatus Parcubacteria bacterium]|jgi:hypothetical protein